VRLLLGAQSGFNFPAVENITYQVQLKQKASKGNDILLRAAGIDQLLLRL
jgi:RsiW-degrading membrane proteinase PrsW (M82 family)